MSWNIKLIGTRANVKAALLADTNLPGALKDAIVLVIDAGENNAAAKADAYYPDGVRLETCGHYGADHTYSSISKLEVEPIRLARAPA